MALKIRLRQMGRRNRVVYRLVLSDARSPRDGKFVEQLGWYNPHEETENVKIDEKRIHFWLERGAILTEKAERLVSKMAPDVMAEVKRAKEKVRERACAKRRASRKKRVTAALA
ncbi:MAG: 30S ribosomal protein S16 [Chlamydiales bacterium]